jgi:hypothetical protein
MLLNTSVWKRLMDAKLKADLAEGVRLWIETSISEIPVWSGASRGTFLKLAAKVGYAVALGGGVPWLNGPSYGQSKSAGRVTIFSGAYVAEYYTSLWHLVYNEYNNANDNPEAGRLFARLHKPGPYNFQSTAAKAFLIFSRKVRLPSPRLALTRTRKTVK